MNTAIFYGIYGLLHLYDKTLISLLPDALVLFIAVDYVYVVVVVIGAVLMSQEWRTKTQMLVGLTALMAGGLTVLLGVEPLHLFYFHPRPYVALQLPHLVDETSNSFPSGHTAFVFALATVVYPYHKRLSYFVFVSGALIGLARIMAGVHYPADVLGGMVLGVAFGAAAAIALVWFGVEAEEA